MGRRLRFGWLAVAWLAASCASRTYGIRADAKPNPGYAYLYGRFFMKAEAPYGSFGGAQTMGMLLQCQDGREYTFGSTDQRYVQVLEVRPSRCWLMEAVFADHDGIVRKRLPTGADLRRPLDFTAGRAHYVGDYFAKADFWTTFENLQTWSHTTWEMDPADDRYESTTAEMKFMYPNLASLPTADTRLVPPAERKPDNGIAAAPGEPPMSPERVARLAPLIKRNYGSPAECEAACPAGQCLPYRSDTGPAMACVIRCDKNGDCPEGLACNCPNSEKSAGPDCHPIARAPQDPMARICLSVEKAGQRR